MTGGGSGESGEGGKEKGGIGEGGIDEDRDHPRVAILLRVVRESRPIMTTTPPFFHHKRRSQTRARNQASGARKSGGNG